MNSEKLLFKLKKFLLSANIDYAVCGGHAIDLFAGYHTRPHKDIDIAVYWEDRDKLIKFMLEKGWIIFEACGGEELHRITDLSDQLKIRRNIFCLKNIDTQWCMSLTPIGNDMYKADDRVFFQTELNCIEFLFNNKENGDFLYARNHSVKRAINKAVLYNADIPYLAPEIVLLYKSTAFNNADYQHDFNTVLPLLSVDSRDWLRGALEVMYPSGHIWLEKMYNL